MPADFAPPPGSVDTHAHVFSRTLRLSPERRYSPDRDAPLDAYLQLLDDHGISRGVLVQPSFLSTDNSYLLDALGKAPDRFRGVAVVEPQTPYEELAQLSETGVCGIRLNLIGRPLPPLGASVWQQLARALGRLDMHLEVQARGEQWDELAPWLHTWPGMVVIDHLGLPGDPSLSHPGSTALHALLSMQHVWVKASAPYRASPGAAQAMLRYLLTRSGTERMIWGSDWPWTQHEGGRTYSTTLHWLTEQLSESEIRDVLCTNPQALFCKRRPWT